MTAEEIVRAEIAAWSTNDVDTVMEHFSDDATFDIGPDWPKVRGRAALRDLMTAFFAGGRCVDLAVRYLAVDGDAVLMERTDHWEVNGRQMSWPVMGAYEVTDGKITAWREYFYLPKDEATS